MKHLAIKHTIQPDVKFMTYSGWMRYIKKTVDKLKTKN